MADLQEKFDLLETTLNNELVERRTEIRACITALVARTHIFLLGPPGTAKSLLLDRLHAYIEGARTFKILMSRFTTPEEVFGPVSLRGLENDQFIRVRDGFLADSELALLDEGFKANSSILNTLLWAINERQYRHGTEVVPIPLSTVFLASNELPQDDTLAALYDRLLFRFEIKPVRDQSNFLRMLKTVRPESPEPILSWDEVKQAQVDAQQVVVPEAVLTALANLRRQLREEGIEPTERRFVESMKIIRAYAYLDGCDVADVEHIRPLQHVLWEQPEQQAVVDKLVIALANPLDQEASELLAEVEKLEQKVDTIKNEDDKHRKGTEIHGKLRKAKRALDDLEARAGNSRRRSETLAEVKARLQIVTERCLKEIFGHVEG